MNLIVPNSRSDDCLALGTGLVPPNASDLFLLPCKWDLGSESQVLELSGQLIQPNQWPLSRLYKRPKKVDNDQGIDLMSSSGLCITCIYTHVSKSLQLRSLVVHSLNTSPRARGASLRKPDPVWPEWLCLCWIGSEALRGSSSASHSDALVF